jgi:hypothetical protein
MDASKEEPASQATSRSPALIKAEDWLSHVAGHIEMVPDQEALVYLLSRGHDCHEQVTGLIESWKEAERERLQEWKKRRPEANVMRIEDASSFVLRDYWGGAPSGDYIFDATMLRTVEWCEIGGFEAWWRRLARSSNEKRLQGGIEESSAAAYWLFNMVRADRAIELMPQVLEGYLESISLSGPDRGEPWEFDGGEHLPYASTIVFARHRLASSNSDFRLVQQAIETISKQQNGSGGWPILTGDPDASIESTAMALHALALAKPPGWSRMAARACDWLWSVQEKQGFWTEPGTSGSVYLTVLVLDAIALTNGNERVTFRRQVSDAPTAVEEKTKLGPRTTLSVTIWDDITISFLSDERVQIWIGNQTETCNYAELGFQDHRDDKPRRAWTLLRIIAETGGTISDTGKTHGSWSQVEKGIQEIRQLLRQYFGISADPVPYVNGPGYKTRFKIERAPSYDN